MGAFFAGGEIGIRTLVGGLLQTRFPVFAVGDKIAGLGAKPSFAVPPAARVRIMLYIKFFTEIASYSRAPERVLFSYSLYLYCCYFLLYL